MPAWVPFPWALRGPGPFYTSCTMGALIIHMLSHFVRAAASQRSCFPSGRSLCSVSWWPRDWKGLWRGHEARAGCTNNHISERSDRVTELLSNQGDFWSGFSGQNSQCVPLLKNPLSVKPFTLSRTSQSALQVIWSARVSEYVQMGCRILRGCVISLVFSLLARLLGLNQSLILTPSLCHWRSYFTLFGMVCLHHQCNTEHLQQILNILYADNKNKKLAKTGNIAFFYFYFIFLFSFLSGFCHFGCAAKL